MTSTILRMHQARDERIEKLKMMLRRSRAVLAQWQRLHLASVRIGEAQQAGLGDSDLFASTVREARRIVETADSLCAEITKVTGEGL